MQIDIIHKAICSARGKNRIIANKGGHEKLSSRGTCFYRRYHPIFDRMKQRENQRIWEVLLAEGYGIRCFAVK
jgi:hypothetical protein